MSPPNRKPSAFHEAIASLEALLAGSARRQIVAEVSKSKTFDRSLRYLRDGMRVHRFEAQGQTLFAGDWVRHFDHVTRGEGLHVLHDWDGKADRFCDETIPVEAANFLERVADPADHAARRSGLFVLLDYACLHLLALVALRAWDEGDPNENLDSVDGLLAHLQGEEGSGQKFARDAATLILIATSHFEPDVTAYERLLAKVRRLNPRHRLNLAITHGAILGSHLRFGLEVTCAGDVAALRDDNVPDYPWLCEALGTLLEAYADVDVEDGAQGHAKSRITEALLIALAPDPQAFLGPRPPTSLSTYADRRDTTRSLFTTHRGALLRDFAVHRPGLAYSPLSFTFNFPHNLVKGIVVDAVLRGFPWTLGLDDLLTALPRTPELEVERVALTTRLMRYALASPDVIRGRPHPAIVYDPAAGARSFEKTIAAL